MQDTIVTIFCYVDDFLKALSWKADSQCRLCLAEIVAISLTAARFFAGNLESARIFFCEHGYIPAICLLCPISLQDKALTTCIS